MPSCHFVHLILLSSGPKVPKSGPFKNEGIHEGGAAMGDFKSAIPKEQSSIAMRKNRLEIAAPTSGIIRLYCYKNAFLKKGDIVAEFL